MTNDDTKKDEIVLEGEVVKDMEFSPAIFNNNKERLMKIVDAVKDITVDPTKITKEELVTVTKTKGELVKYRMAITTEGEAHRKGARKFASDVIAYENELVDILAPEEERLKKIIKDSKEYALKEVRKEKLPELHERLDAIGDNIKVINDFLLRMDPTEFETYYNERVRIYNEAQTAKIDAKQAVIDRKEEDEKIKEQAAKDERERIEREQQEKEETEQREAEEAAAKKINDRTDVLRGMKMEFDGESYTFITTIVEHPDVSIKVSDIESLSDADFAVLVEKSKNKIEVDKQKVIEIDETKEREADKRYQAFLKDNGWTEETKDDFQLHPGNSDGSLILYKKVAEYKPE